MRTGGIAQTTLNYTGQRLDGTGLLYYHARYYDPNLARFISPDSIVPATASGGQQNSKLSVDFHETTTLMALNSENALVLNKGFYFQLIPQDQSSIDPFGPRNPQSLNRFSYVLNNPMTHTDPTGHLRVYRGSQANDFLFMLDTLIAQWSTVASDKQKYNAMIAGLTNLGPAILQFLSSVIQAADSSFADDMLDLLLWMRKYVRWINGEDPRLHDGDYVDFDLVPEYLGTGPLPHWLYYMLATVHTSSGAVPPNYLDDRTHLLGHFSFFGYTGDEIFYYLVGLTNPVDCSPVFPVMQPWLVRNPCNPLDNSYCDPEHGRWYVP